MTRAAEGLAFDDPLDSDAGRLWLDLAGVEPEELHRELPSAAAPANPAGRSAPAVPTVDVERLLTRASDLPTPAPRRGPGEEGVGTGPTTLPWSHPDTPLPAPTGRRGREKPDGVGPSRAERADRSEHASQSAASTERSRRPGPAPLPEDPRAREEAAREVVLRQLAMGPRSRGQLERKLAEREAEPELIARILDRFEEVRLVDDAAFAEVWVRSRHRSRGLSRSAIGRELREKGVDRDLADQALEEIAPEDEHAAARELVERKLRSRPVPGTATREERAERDKVVRRLVGMLGRKGYGPSLAFTVVKEVLAGRGD